MSVHAHPADSPTSSRSSKKSCRFPDGTPVLAITPISQHHLPTPPLTPLTPCLKTTAHRTSFFPANCVDLPAVSAPTLVASSPVSPLLGNVLIRALPLQTPSPASWLASIPIPTPTPYDTDHHLHAPLCAHLTLLHPATPREVIHFCATRLLSTDRPLGYGEPYTAIEEQGHLAPKCWDKRGGEEGELEEEQWTPLWAGLGDLATAGLGLEAAKGCTQVGPGRQADERLQWMYGVARRSWALLEMRAPSQGSRL